MQTIVSTQYFRASIIYSMVFFVGTSTQSTLEYRVEVISQADLLVEFLNLDDMTATIVTPLTYI